MKTKTTDGPIMTDGFEDFEYNLLSQVKELAAVDYDALPLSFKENTIAFAFLHHAQKILPPKVLRGNAGLTIRELRKRLQTYEHFKTFCLAIHCATLAYRAGALPEKITEAQSYEAYRESQAEKRKGKTSAKLEARNKKIIEGWEKSKSRLSKNSFAKRQAKLYGLSPSRIKQILPPSK